MRFSLFYNFDILPNASVHALYREVEEQAVVADRLGFDAIYLAEHHFELYGRLPSPLVFLARLSALTERLDLGTAVIEGPYYHPLRLAEDAAILDALSGGRLRLGVGTGGRKAAEFAKFGVPNEERAARTLELLEILRQAFDAGAVTIDGAHHCFSRVEINPRPSQPARQLLWLAASDATVELAGRQGYRLLIPRVGAADRHRGLIDRYRAALDGQPGFVAQLRFVYVAETEQEAREQTQRTFARYAQHDCGVTWDGRADSAEYGDLMRRMNMVIGTPERVVEQLAEWQSAYGFDEIICQIHAAGMRHEDSLRAIDLLAREVVPRLQVAAAPR